MADNFHRTKKGMNFELNATPVNLEDGDLWFDGYSFNFRADGYDQSVGAVETQNNGAPVETLTTVMNFGDNLTATPGASTGEVLIDLNPWIPVSSPGPFPSAPGNRIFADTLGGPITIILPGPTAPLGATIRVADPTASWGVTPITIDPGPNLINGTPGPLVVTTPNIAYEFIFYAPTGNWIIMTPRSTLGG